MNNIELFKSFLNEFQESNPVIIESIKQGFDTLFESVSYLQANEVPIEIREYANQIIGRNITKYTLNQSGKLNVSMPWHEAAREYYQAFKLLPHNHAEKVGNSFMRNGMEGVNGFNGGEVEGTGEIPSGHVFAVVCTYPPHCEIHTSKDANMFIQNESVDLSESEAIALKAAASLKAAYRRKFPEEIYNSLISKGYMNRNKSITVKGRNILTNPKVIELIGRNDGYQSPY